MTENITNPFIGNLIDKVGKELRLKDIYYWGRICLTDGSECNYNRTILAFIDQVYTFIEQIYGNNEDERVDKIIEDKYGQTGMKYLALYRKFKEFDYELMDGCPIFSSPNATGMQLSRNDLIGIVDPD